MKTHMCCHDQDWMRNIKRRTSRFDYSSHIQVKKERILLFQGNQFELSSFNLLFQGLIQIELWFIFKHWNIWIYYQIKFISLSIIFVEVCYLSTLKYNNNKHVWLSTNWHIISNTVRFESQYTIISSRISNLSFVIQMIYLIRSINRLNFILIIRIKEKFKAEIYIYKHVHLLFLLIISHFFNTFSQN
jgi:hypothetical protein